jgi:effector-binding domain-containing protein
MGQPELGMTLGRLFGEVMQTITGQGAENTGPGITLFHDPDYREQDIDVGACLAFTGELRENDQVKVIELPAVETMACVIHHGSFTTMRQAYHAILGWIEANGYRVNGPNRELNLEFEPEGDESKFVTEIQFPVAKGDARTTGSSGKAV